MQEIKPSVHQELSTAFCPRSYISKFIHVDPAVVVDVIFPGHLLDDLSDPVLRQLDATRVQRGTQLIQLNGSIAVCIQLENTQTMRRIIYLYE